MTPITEIQNTHNDEKQQLIDNIVKIWCFCFGRGDSGKKRYYKILNSKSIEWLRRELRNDKELYGDKISHLEI